MKKLLKNKPLKKIFWLGVLIIFLSLIDLGANIIGFIPFFGDLADLLSNTILEIVDIVIGLFIVLALSDK